MLSFSYVSLVTSLLFLIDNYDVRIDKFLFSSQPSPAHFPFHSDIAHELSS